MVPEIMPDDRLLIFRFWPKGLVYRGQIVLIREKYELITEKEVETQKKYVKRVVGLPQDTVSLRSSQIPFVDRIHSLSNAQGQIWNIPPRHIFVRGNNLTSCDSTSWGPIPIRCIEGVVVLAFHKTKADIRLSASGYENHKILASEQKAGSERWGREKYETDQAGCSSSNTTIFSRRNEYR